ncbi:uncharacterized protein EI97DRAFT_72190 [Westerdykella ornata]|uniref:Uncharacterized protein n=1 Tax=Westerdykella ornata TaxID=318751 RepID=A0A6A6JGD0_WESOR|nr:uncharacterized protein EI97DRAFT_72190 [Westerdykella ornata]KAF2275325.1 hypothetical protein EI97DRAFT_72190 [Westerdykella ornata]
MPKYPWRRFRTYDPHCMEDADGYQQTTSGWRCGTSVSAVGKATQDDKQLELSRCLSPCGFPQHIPYINRCARLRNPQAGVRYVHSNRPLSEDERHIPKAITPSDHHCQKRLLRSLQRSSAVICYILLVLVLLTSASASSLHTNHTPIIKRQAVPDRFGNTGNEPAPVASQPPPRPATASLSPTASPASSVFPTGNPPTSTAISTGTRPLPSGFDLPNGNGNLPPPGEFENDPGAPLAPLTRTSPRPALSIGAMAGLAGAGFVIICIIVALSVWIYKRRPSANVEEIPIRRSKLSSRLGFRLFGEGGALSRSGSRNESRAGLRRDSEHSNEGREKEVEAEKGWLSKRDISRPKPMKDVWVENGLLGVPKPAFLKEARGEGQDTSAPWAGNGNEDKVKPGRPRSAEPLGRLSGMGLGMGYLK